MMSQIAAAGNCAAAAQLSTPMATAPVSSRVNVAQSPARSRIDSPSTSVTSATSGGGGASSDRTRRSNSPSKTCWSATVRATSSCSPVVRTRVSGRTTEPVGSSSSSMSRGIRPLTASSLGTTRSALRADPITVSRVNSVIACPLTDLPRVGCSNLRVRGFLTVCTGCNLCRAQPNHVNVGCCRRLGEVW
jgi:hypothetical protein